MEGTQTGGLEGIVQSILIFISEVVFQWIPAIVDSITGAGSTGAEESVGQGMPADVHEEDVSLDGIVYTAEGTAYPLPGTEPIYFEGQSGQEIPAQTDTSGLWSDASALWDVVAPFSIFISLILAVGIIYTVIRTIQIRTAEKLVLRMAEHPDAVAHDPPPSQRRWAQIVEQSTSRNESDWRLAILEADIMLDELLEVQGYHGDTMGDKMKQVEKSDFNTINLAWEAHKVRNQIAHAGSEHLLNEREVKRVINLYEQVFREFHFV